MHKANGGWIRRNFTAPLDGMYSSMDENLSGFDYPFQMLDQPPSSSRIGSSDSQTDEPSPAPVKRLRKAHIGFHSLHHQ